MSYRVCTFNIHRDAPDVENVELWNEYPSAIDVEDAASDHCKWQDEQGVFCDGYPQDEKYIVYDVKADEYSIVTISTDWSPWFCGYEEGTWLPPEPPK